MGWLTIRGVEMKVSESIFSLVMIVAVFSGCASLRRDVTVYTSEDVQSVSDSVDQDIERMGREELLREHGDPYARYVSPSGALSIWFYYDGYAALDSSGDIFSYEF